MRAWYDFLDSQEGTFGKIVVEDWLRSLRIVRFDAGNLFVEASHPFQIAWIQEHLRFLIKEGFPGPSGRKIRFHIALQGSTKQPEPAKPGSVSPAESIQFSSSPLLPSGRFDLFITSKSNFFTREVLQKNYELYNPLYIYGPSGSGKTHLLMAMAENLLSKGKRVLYTRAEKFTEHVVWGIRQGIMHNVRSFYRNTDVLIIDDIEILSGKTATQEEFFHTFNTLHSEGKSIILSSKASPSHLQQVEPRLISRFEWGITLPLAPIDHPEDLKELLDRRLRFISLSIENSLSKYLLETFKTAADLSEAIDYLLILSSKQGKKHLTLNGVGHELANLKPSRGEVTTDKILEMVADLFDLKASDISGKSQNREFALARKICMYLMRKELRMPYMKIGQLLARDHSTVMSSVRQVHVGIEKNDRELTHYLSDLQGKIAACQK